MELKPIDESAMIPSQYDGVTEILKIVLNEEHNDTVLEEERETKNNKGTFKQYSLFLENSEGEPKTMNYLFLKQLNPLLKNVSPKTQDWANTFVEVTATTREANGQKYFDFVLTPCSMPQWAEEKVK